MIKNNLEQLSEVLINNLKNIYVSNFSVTDRIKYAHLIETTTLNDQKSR